MPTNNEISARRFWPSSWLKDEQFWRDVAKNTAAALLTALIIALVAGGLGYIQSPSGEHILLFIVAATIFLACSTLSLFTFMATERRYNAQSRRKTALGNILLGLVALAIISAVFTVGFFVLQAAGRWLGL